MFKVEQHITNKEENLKSHPFFQKLEVHNNFMTGMAFVPSLTFWVMVFQDILHMIPSHIQSKNLRRIAVHHKHEDAGHDKWFLEDVAFLEKKNHIDVASLFSPEYRKIREAVYRIVTETFQGIECQKITLILVLESTGHVFFKNIAEFAKRHNKDSYLKYFSSYHLEVEMNHAVFEEELKKELNSIVLSEEDRSQIISMIDRVYDAFYTIFDHLHESIALAETGEMERLVA